MKESYMKIIETQWPQASLRPHMSLSQRAKIFLPFSALTGYEESLADMRKSVEKNMEEKRGSERFDDLLTEEVWEQRT